jgi:hypothetical protein
MMGTVFSFFVQERSITMFLSVAVLPKSVDSVACDFFPNICLGMFVKKNYGEAGFQDALFANFGSCLHHV